MSFKKGDKVLVEGKIGIVDFSDNDRTYEILAQDNTFWVSRNSPKPIDQPQGNCPHWDKPCKFFKNEECFHPKIPSVLTLNSGMFVKHMDNCPFQETRKEAPSVWETAFEEIKNRDRFYDICGDIKEGDLRVILDMVQKKLKQKGWDIR